MPPRGKCALRRVTSSPKNNLSQPPEQPAVRLASELAGDSLEFRVLSSLSRVLVTQRDVTELLEEVLRVLQGKLGFLHGALSLLRGAEFVIEASYGLSEGEKARGTYALGEGITGQVGETGVPAVIPDTTRDANFLNRTGVRPQGEAESFLCVPIKHSGAVIGTLSLDFALQTEGTLGKLKNLLVVVANILADAVESVRSHVEERQRLERENDRMRLELGEQSGFASIVGHSSAMRAIHLEVAQVARSNATVLLRGESGTGKELIAQAIHYASDRRQGPFVAVNCAALPESLIESELFGHEKGAFTGAHKQRIGRFEMASAGTLFLDEIGDISLQTQVKLLRVLQERVFERVGSQTPIPTNARIIAATSRDLEAKMKEGVFREDLYFRLNVFPIHVPALRARKADIVSLADYFLSKYNKAYDKNVVRLSTPAIDMLMSYHWPGNVRELENMIERAVLVSSSGVINSFDLPASLQTAANTGTAIEPSPDSRQGAGLEVLTSSFEKELISAALKRTRGNVAAAARDLETTERKLHYRIRRLQISPSFYK